MEQRFIFAFEKCVSSSGTQIFHGSIDNLEKVGSPLVMFAVMKNRG